MQKKNRYLYYSILPCCLLLLVIGSYAFSYKPPTEGPPFGNLPAPLNASLEEQTKAGNLIIEGNLTTGGVLTVGGVLTTEGFKMTEGAGDNKVLTTDASGVASWQTVAGGATPGGSPGYVQFNGEGGFASSPNLFWDNINKRLGIGTTEPDNELTITGGNVHIGYESDSGSEFITNGDMEAIDNWPSSLSPTINERSNEQAHGGTYSRKVAVDERYDGIQQDVSTTADTLYKASFWIYGDGINGVMARIWVGYNANFPSMNEGNDFIPPASWNQHTLYFTAESGVSRIEFLADEGENAGIWYIDDCSIKEVFGGDLIVEGQLTGGGTSGIRILPSGNVGIGTTNPGATLQVEGDMRIKTGASYSQTYSYSSSWASGFQTIIPAGTLAKRAVYIVRIWTSSFGQSPYYAETAFLFTTSLKTGGAGVGPSMSQLTSHHANSSSYWSTRTTTTINLTNGLEAQLVNGPSADATVYVSATRIM